MAVQVGDLVRRGQTLFRDRRNEGVCYTAPAGGTVSAIHRGAKRALLSVVIDVGEDEAESFQSFDSEAISHMGRKQLRDLLLHSGLWTALKTRPFSLVPAPDSDAPNALFINAMDSEPLSANPELIINTYKEEFMAGLQAVETLSAENTYVCKAAGAEVPVTERMEAGRGIYVAEFAGPHPAGLTGTHIHIIAPAGRRHTVWTISYQDVIAIGDFLLSGVVPAYKVISLAGPQVRRPRLVRTRYGASLEELCAGELEAGENRLVSGSVLSGRHARGALAFLGRYHRQVSVLAEDRRRELFGWLSPGRRRHSNMNIYLSSFLGRKRRLPLTTNRNGSERAMVPTGNYERVMPLDILPTHLLRYLMVGDTDMAQKLGCLELDEEDLALCTYVCSGKYEYGPILRQNLDRILEEG